MVSTTTTQTTVTGFTRMAIHARYSSDITYVPNWLSAYFAAIRDAWRLALSMAHLRHGEISEATEGNAVHKYRDLLRSNDFSDDPSSVESLPHIVKADSFRLVVQRLHLNSPLEITLATAGSTGVTIYALYLLSTILRDAERLGSWLPRLVASWHRAWRDPATAWRWNKYAKEYEDLLELAIRDELEKLHDNTQHIRITRPVDLTVDADSEIPPDIAAAWRAEYQDDD